MIDEPMLKLSISLESNPGAYALVIGSGVSRAAGILTGWEIVLELINKLAAMENEESKPDPENWYHVKYGKPPKYDELLDRLTTTSSERMSLLRSYFEPTSEEREQGLKMPTGAHRAIAKLVNYGNIRMIITTNFDRLIEMALEDEGIVPDIISSDDGLNGALPYVHSKCYVVKLHGDYTDPRIKNTPEELACYSVEMNSFLDRVFDEFGLIISGWSGSYDKALRDAIMRCPSRRFTTFWLLKGDSTEEAKKLIQHRKAEVIPIESADQSFTELVEKVESLKELARSDPRSIPLAVATIKRYLVNPQYKIDLHDLMQREVERAYNELTSDKIKLPNNLSPLLHQYEALIEKLMAMLTALSYYDTGDNGYLLTKCIERLTNPQKHDNYTTLQSYPALLLIYCGGIAAIEANNYNNLYAILVRPKYREYYYEDYKPILSRLNPANVFGNYYNSVPRPNAEREYAAGSNYIYDVVKPFLKTYIADEAKLDDIYDIFEYILSLTYRDLIGGEWSPIGRFGWRYSMRGGIEHSQVAQFISSGIEKGGEWELLRAGFFNGSEEHFKDILSKNREWHQRVMKQHF